MSDEIQSTKYGTVGFERKVSGQGFDGDYGHTVESIFLPFEVVEGDLGATVQKAIEARTEAAGLVLNNLGIEFEFTEDGTLREKARPVVSTPAPQAAPAQATYPLSSPNGYEVIKRKKVNGVGVPDPEWLPAQIEAARRKNPAVGTKFWDNRSDDGTAPSNPRAPWFKCKDSGEGIWAPK